VVLFDLKGATAGMAIGGHTIRLNTEALENYTDDMLHNTIPHEVAHIACQQWYPKENVHHGYKWQYMMYRLGLEPARCHNYDYTPARRRKGR
jgi:SprT protein